jgi:hypothetical protein
LDSVIGPATFLSDVLVDGLRVEGRPPRRQNIIKIYGDEGDLLQNVRIVNSVFATEGSGDVITNLGLGKVTGLTVSNNQINISDDGGICFNRATDIVISNNVIYNTRNAAVALSGTQRFVVSNNMILSDQAAENDGISINEEFGQPDFGIVEGNFIRAGSSGVALLVRTPATPGSILVVSNITAQGSVVLP